ncbi:LacI family transcriptional regulator [Gemmatimonadetes bacterium T265]|nr:LacI family transcriptional regulator [Gemmatimonadetes bacterium T265]
MSKATVSAVLNATGSVRGATRERVLAAIETLNYRPSVGAGAAVPRAGDARSAGRTIGLLIKEAENPYYAGLVAGVRVVADACGYTLLVTSSEGDYAAERRAVELMYAKEVDGMLVTPLLDAFADLSHYFNLKRRDFPFVLLEEVRGLPASLVDIDNVRAAWAATDHLIALGHTRLVHFAGPAYSVHAQERVHGVRRACSAVALVFHDAHVVRAGAHLDDGYRAALAYFGAVAPGERPTGVTCYNDLIALGVCRALTELGLRVPEDVSVVGFDDIPIVEYLPVPLTTVRIPQAEMGRLAAELLVAQINGGAPARPVRQFLDAQLVVRASTHPPAGAAPRREAAAA